MPAVESFRLFEMGAVQPARPAPEDARPKEVPDPVIGVVAQEGCRHEHRHQCGRVDAIGRQSAGHEQQRIPRQKGGHHQSRLAEDDQEQHHIEPPAIVLQQPHQVLVEVQDDVQELGNELHSRSLAGSAGMRGGVTGHGRAGTCVAPHALRAAIPLPAFSPA